MAIAIDQASLGTASDSTANATVALTTSATVASGGFIVVVVTCWTSSETITLDSVSGGSLTWTVDKFGDAASPNNVHVGIASAQAPSGLSSGTTLTATFSETPGATKQIGASSFTGVKTSSPVDTTAGPTGVSTAAWSTGDVSIAAGSVLIGACFREANTGNTVTSPSIEAWDTSGGSVDGVTLCYRIETSAGSYAVAGTWGSAGGNTNIAVAYLADSGAVTTTYQSLQPTVGGRW